MKNTPTLDDLRQIDRDYLIPGEICGVLGCDAYRINVAARNHPELLGVPVVVINSRVKIPRIPFLRYFGMEI